MLLYGKISEDLGKSSKEKDGYRKGLVPPRRFKEILFWWNFRISFLMVIYSEKYD